MGITTPPSSTAQSGFSFTQQPVVQLRDANGNNVSQSGVSVTASLATGGGTLGGTTSIQTNSSGQAVFTNLAITGIVGPRTLQFTSTGLTAATSSTIDLTPGPASQLAFTTPPSSTAQSGVAFTQQPVLQLRDASGNNVTQSGVSATATIATGGGTLGGTTSVQTNGSGQLIFTNLTITGIVGPRTLQFNSTGLTAATSGTIDLTPGPASQLVLTTPPSSTAQSGVAFTQQPVVQLRDASGNNVSETGVSVTASLATGSGTLGGTTTVQTNASGQAVYTNLVITGAGAHTIQFSATGLTSDTSNTIDLTPVSASQLVITTQPADTARSGVTLARQPVVQMRDAVGNDVSQSGVSVTASLATGSGTISGTTAVQTNSSGQAAYSNLAITGAGTYTLQFSATGLSPDTSSSITLPTVMQDNVPVTALSDAQGSARWFVLQVPNGASQLVVSTGGGTGDADLYVRYDALPDTFPGNFDCRSITSTTTEQCTVANPSAGSWFILLYGFNSYSGVSLTATTQAATQLVITTQAADTARSGVALARQPAVQLRDAVGTDVSQAGVSVTAGVASGNGTLSGTTTIQTNASGQVAYTNLVITGAGAHTLRFTATGLTPDTSTSITLPTPLQDNVPVTALGGAQGSTRWFAFQVPGGASQLVVSTSGGTGDADLFVRYNALPTTTVNGCSSESVTTTEDCTLANPSAGSWFILLYGFNSYAGVTLNATTSTSCTLNSPGDADGDRLPNCVETNTGVFVSTLNTGTDPNNGDTDGDAIPDGDEVLGTLLGLDLPTMGVSPLRRDVLVEYDWFDDALECGFHSHRPTAAALAMVAVAFANAPLVNPDGTSGIHLIQDYGQGGVFTGGNLIADADGVLTGGVNDAEFQSHKSANHNSNRDGYFHYTSLPHRYATNSGSSGQAEYPGDDLIVSLQCFGSDHNAAHTIMHELGHNLFLDHGGFEATNYKPNYNSVMNYLYQFSGVDNNCTPPGDGRLNYSLGGRPQLNENNLDETKGICGSPPGPGWDWNGDGDALDVGIAFDINVDDVGIGDGFFGVLQDYNDWAFLVLNGLSDADGAPLVARKIISCTNPAPNERR